MFKHQGDIPVYPYTGKLPGEEVKHTGSVVLALGEHTGHKHVLTVADPDTMTVHKDGETFYITLKTEAELTHNQHGPLTIEPGTYRVGQEREVDWFADGITRQVID